MSPILRMLRRSRAALVLSGFTSQCLCELCAGSTERLSRRAGILLCPALSPAGSQGHSQMCSRTSPVLLLMLTTQFCNHCPGQLVKPKRDDPAFIGRLFTHCQLQDPVLQSVPL